jgi:hypothetical protein
VRLGVTDNEGVWLAVTVVEMVAEELTDGDPLTLGLSLIVGVGVGLVGTGCP